MKKFVLALLLLEMLMTFFYYRAAYEIANY